MRQQSFHFPVGGNDASDVTCADCGHLVGTMGSLKDQVAKAVIEGDYPPSERSSLANMTESAAVVSLLVYLPSEFERYPRMNELVISNTLFRARHCRRLAAAMDDDGAKESLLGMAREIEADVKRLQQDQQPD